MSDTANKKKSKKGGARNKSKSGQSNLVDSKEIVAESPFVKKTGRADLPPLNPTTGDVDNVDDQSLPTTPHRVFRAFNDSVDINMEELRDMLPEDTWRDVQPEGLGEEGGAELQDADTTFVGPDEALSALNVILEEDQESFPTPSKSPLKTSSRPPLPSATKKPAADETELELELLSAEECSSGTESLGNAEELTTEPDGSKRVVAGLYEPKYRFGPAIKRRRGTDVFSGLKGEPSAGGRSYAEVAEAVVLTVLDAVRPSQNPTFRTDEPKRSEETERELRTAGLGGRVRGALGYVLHTALSLVYAVFVHYPLELFLGVAGFWWGVASTMFGVVLGAVSWAWGVYVWTLLLPVRLVQRGAVLLWQRALLLAVQFLNTHPAAGAAETDPHAVQKHTIPTALNGHAHKH